MEGWTRISIYHDRLPRYLVEKGHSLGTSYTTECDVKFPFFLLLPVGSMRSKRRSLRAKYWFILGHTTASPPQKEAESSNNFRILNEGHVVKRIRQKFPGSLI